MARAGRTCLRQLLIGQAAQKRQQILTILPGQRQGSHALVFIRIVVTAAAGCVVIQHAFECRNTAIVHIRRRDRDIAQRRRPKRADINRAVAHHETPKR